MLSYMTTRMIEIIKLLSGSSNYMSGKALAEQLGVSSRTIRDDIRAINDELKPYNILVTSKKGKGYATLSSTQEINTLLNSFRTEDTANNDYPITPEDRVRFIMKMFLFSKVTITIQQLAHDLYVSDSTLKKDLRKVKEVFSKYNIEITSDNQGLFARGNELNKRFCLSDYFIYNENFEDTLMVNLMNNFGYKIEDADINQIKHILLQELDEENIDITDETLSKIAVHIIIAIKRIKSAQPVSQINNILTLKDEVEYTISQKISSKIGSLYNIEFSEQEIAYITLHLVGNRLYQKNENVPHDLQLYLGDEIYRLSTNIVENIGLIIKGLDLEEDKELLYTVGLHLKQLMTRLAFNMNIRNPLLSTIKIKYPLAFEAGVIASKYVEDVTGYTVNENEIGFLALHFGTVIERQRLKTQTKVKVAVVCASGMATSELLLTKLSRALEHDYTLMGAYPLHKLDELVERQPDVILTTISIDKKTDIPVIPVPSILGNDDVTVIQDSIKSMTQDSQIITQYLQKDLFFTDIKTTYKDETLTTLLNRMLEGGYINQKVSDSIWERECISPTSIGNMVAIPHPLNIIADRSFLCTALLNEPVEWAPNEYVKLVFVIVLAPNLQTKFQKIFESLYDVIQAEENVEKLYKSQSFTSFINKIESM